MITYDVTMADTQKLLREFNYLYQLPDRKILTDDMEAERIEDMGKLAAELDCRGTKHKYINPAE